MEVSVPKPRREGTVYCRGDLTAPNLPNLGIKWKRRVSITHWPFNTRGLRPRYALSRGWMGPIAGQDGLELHYPIII